MGRRIVIFIIPPSCKRTLRATSASGAYHDLTSPSQRAPSALAASFCA